ncbi:MAG: class I SAM-dependent methyltransferase [bacterium]
MPHQGNTWDREYRNPKLVTKGDEPQADTLRIFKFLKKEEKFVLEDKTVLDLGCGTGRNSNYIAERGNKVIGIEIYKTALELAKQRARDIGVSVDYRLGDIGASYDIAESSIDLIIDVTSSNSLDEKGRDVYLSECARALKPGGYFFVRALCKDGNKNVKNLLKDSPGREHDTYIIKEINLTERVFSKEDFINMYGKLFKILKLEKKSGYSTFNGRIYKRDYWLTYMVK